MVLFRYDVFLDNHLHNSPSFSSCVSIHHHCLAQNGLFSLGHIGYDCYELHAYLKVEQINFDIQFWKQCCSVMHDWRKFNNVSFESTIIILYDNSMTTVIHPTSWSQHTFVLGFCFFWDALYIDVVVKSNIIHVQNIVGVLKRNKHNVTWKERSWYQTTKLLNS